MEAISLEVTDFYFYGVHLSLVGWAEPLTLDEERDCSAYTDDVEVSSP